MTSSVGAKDAVLQSIRQARRDWGLWEKGQTVLAACSGGPDSVCLLHALVCLREEEGIKIAVGHVDHGLRKCSGDDAEFVARWAGKMGLPCGVRKVDIQSGGENAARIARYKALCELAEESSAHVIATAHTLDDHAETLIMRLVRGTGPRGMKGIPVKRGCIVRPMLGITRLLVEQYLEECDLSARSDPTNFRTDPFRNRVRLELLPALKAENPNILEALWGVAAGALEEKSALEYLARKYYSDGVQLILGPNGESAIKIETGLLPENRAARAGLLSHFVIKGYEEEVRVPAGDAESAVARSPLGQLERKHLSDLERMVSMHPGNREVRFISLPGKVTGLITKDWLAICPANWLEGSVAWSWMACEKAPLKPTGFVLNSIRFSDQPAGNEALMSVSFRNRRAGDRVKTLSGHRKLQDYFVDKGVPLPLRERIPLWENPESGCVCVPICTGSGSFELATSCFTAEFSLEDPGIETALYRLFGTFGL